MNPFELFATEPLLVLPPALMGLARFLLFVVAPVFLIVGAIFGPSSDLPPSRSRRRRRRR